jgi:LPXTG-motif cell wall-anchored protein
VPRVPIRRALAYLVSALVVVVGAFAVPAGPAAATSAAQALIVGECTTEQQAIIWTVTIPAEVGAYRLAEVTAQPPGSELTGLGDVPDELGFPRAAGEPLTIEQLLPAGTTEASLTVLAEWDGGGTGSLTSHATCEGNPPTGLLDGFSFDCQWLTITIENPHDDDVHLTLVPSGGEPVDVEVAASGSTSVQFPAGAGQSVDVTSDGRSIVDPAHPITITPAQFADLDCNGAGGQAADLPATGSRIALVIVGALALLGLGGGLYLLARRRRIRFTA